MTLRRLSIALLVLFAIVTILSVFGEFIHIKIPGFAFTLTGFAFAMVHAGQREGWKGALMLAGLVFGVSLLFESVGVATGWVYGPYHYTDLLGEKFLGLVPYTIPVVWFLMSYPSFVIAEWLAWPGGEKNRTWRRVLSVAAMGGLVMTAWDVIMDPIMVAGGHWVWDADGAYFGIPLQNFWGWWLTVFTTYALYMFLRRKVSRAAEAGFDRLALLAYLVTAFSTVTGALINGRGDLALIGFFTMTPWVIMGWMKMGRRED